MRSPLLAPRPTYPKIDCVGGPACGMECPYSPSGWLNLVSLDCTGAHRYILAQDDTGARYWSYVGYETY